MSAVAEKPTETGVGLLDNIEQIVREVNSGAQSKVIAPPGDEPPEEKEEPKPEPKPEENKDKAPDEKKEVPDFDPEAPKAEPKAGDEPFPKTAVHWKEYKAKMKAEVDAAMKRAEEAEKKLLEQKPVVGAEEVETLKKKLTEYDELLMVTNVERHPKFQAYFDGKYKSLIETAKAVGGEKIANLMQLPEGQHRDALLNEAFSELNPLQQSQVGPLLVRKSELDREKATEIGRAREAYAALEAQKEQQRKARTEQATRVLEETITRWSQTSPFLKEGSESAEAIKGQARAIYAGQMDDAGMAKASLWAAKGPHMAAMLKTQAEEISRLKEENDNLRKAKPSLTGDTAGGGEKGENLSSKGLLDMF